MYLPFATHAVIPPEKVTRYLLNPTNLNNQGKPGFFFRFGFTIEGWQILAAAFQEHARQYEVSRIEPTETV